MTERNSFSKFLTRYGGDLAALAVLIVGAWLAGGFLLRDDLFIYGDHPGHYWLTWFTLEKAIPHLNLAAWMPYWYAGYPELQFYPPGFALVAWLVRTLSFNQLSIVFAYETTVFIAYAFPAFTLYYALRHLRFGIPTALAGGVFGLIFPAIFGGTGAPFIGMIGSRLAFALNPLVLVWLMDVADGRGKRYWFLSVAALASAILLHPYHEIGILLAVALYVLIARLNLIRAALAVGSVVLVSVLVDAFWVVPLFAHASSEMIPILRTTFDQTRRHLITEELYPYALLSLGALLVVRKPAELRQRAFVLALFALVILLAVVMLGIHVVLIDQLQIFQIDPVRLIGEYYLAIVMLAAVGLGAVAQAVADWLGKSERTRRAVAAGMVGVVCAYGAYNFYQAHQYYFPRADREPRFLQAAREDYALDEFWQVLSETQGRIWFTSFYQHLNKRETDPLATTLTALTPLYTNREIMGGTYSRWSPIAALMWVGDPDPQVLHGLVEETDDRSLFGVPIEQVTPEQVADWITRFNITTLVASADDYQTRVMLDTLPFLQSYYNNGLFFAYRVLDSESKWVEGTRANLDNVAYDGERITFHVKLANGNGRAHVKVYAAPLWQARRDDGTLLPVQRDEYGLVEIPLPKGRDYNVTLTYEPGATEQAGTIISAVTILALAGGAGYLLYRRRRPAPQISSQPVPGALSPDQG